MNKIDYNSVVNQEIKYRFIQREVYCCFSYEMDSILNASGETKLPVYDDFENLFYFNKDGVIDKIIEEWERKDEKFKNYANDSNTFNKRVKNKSDFEVFLNGLSDEELENLSLEFDIDIDDEKNQYHEIFEYWIVSEFLYKKLKEKGQPVLEWGNNYYWGRCTTGQAILLDDVISSICSDMEILENQKYSWSKWK